MKPQVVFLICADAEWEATLESLAPPIKNPTPYGQWFPAGCSANLPVMPATVGSEIPSKSIPVIFFHTGWGKVAAAGGTQYAISRWKPSLLVNLGTCGGFSGYVERGEILLVDHTIIYDIYEQMGDPQAHIDHYTCLLDYTWLQENFPQPVRRTLLVSGDRDLFPHEVQHLAEKYGAVAGDWESGAMAYVAQRNKTRLLILRGVTDLVGAEGGDAYGDLEYFRTATRGIMSALLTHLYAWVRTALP